MELTAQTLIESAQFFEAGQINLHEWKKSRFLISRWEEMETLPTPDGLMQVTIRDGRKITVNKSVLDAWKALNPNNERVTN